MKRKNIIVVEAADAAEPVVKKTVVRKLSVIKEQLKNDYFDSEKSNKFKSFLKNSIKKYFEINEDKL